ncbi:copper homeostasis protein CutC [Spiroplasma cantharicola]|uniref:Copper homeostasis protein cutC homolog n=1 Tax=Spiroplasma cantharicola TaxID=362837 RepID=A0A0M4JT82_9MOLU|nr:copper homeostasis protein CutC [Spiroplasma cantharicola]ALD66721.1 copper homeostasis protein [Spiroplasma cantharicola]
MLLEVIAKDFKDIRIINNSNANRIEFCEDLKVGGLTPALEDIKYACDLSKLPINIIVRNTSRDFFYTDKEKKDMIEQIKFIKTTKANGIVIGALNKDLTIDVDFLNEVIKHKGNLEITFHKAFDEVKDFIEAFKILDKLGITNVLTSGGKDIKKGKKVIKKLATLNLNTKILIGGGVNQKNFSSLKKISKNIHVGSCVRNNQSWDESVNDKRINELLETN